MKAMAQLERINFRRHRAMSFTAALIDELRDILPPDSLREVHERVYDLMYRNGSAWTNDEERSRLRLEHRDDLGWTPSERVASKMREQQAMLTISNSIIDEVFLRCDKCGRKSFSRVDLNETCDLIQPNSENCKGTMTKV